MQQLGLALTVEVGGREFDRIETALTAEGDLLEKGVEGAAKPVARELLKSLEEVANRLKQFHGTPWNGDMTGSSGTLYSRTGRGLKEIARSVQVKGADLDMIAGQITAPFPMSVHETGAVVRPKRAKYLTIPLPAAMDSRGVPLRRRARDWDNTFVARSRRGNLLIFRKEGQEIVPLYVLKRQVLIPPRLRMEKTINSWMLPYFEKKAFETISNHIDKTFR